MGWEWVRISTFEWGFITTMNSRFMEPDCLFSNPGSALLNFVTLGRVPTAEGC